MSTAITLQANQQPAAINRRELMKMLFATSGMVALSQVLPKSAVGSLTTNSFAQLHSLDTLRTVAASNITKVNSTTFHTTFAGKPFKWINFRNYQLILDQFNGVVHAKNHVETNIVLKLGSREFVTTVKFLDDTLQVMNPITHRFMNLPWVSVPINLTHWLGSEKGLGYLLEEGAKFENSAQIEDIHGRSAYHLQGIASAEALSGFIPQAKNEYLVDFWLDTTYGLPQRFQISEQHGTRAFMTDFGQFE
ncbi:MAG: LppX_LprAFG lipoprotein [Chloroflexota bacterium]